MSLLTIAGIAAGLWLAWSYGRDLLPRSNCQVFDQWQREDELDEDAAACMCCDLSRFFADRGDREAQKLVGELAKRVVAPVDEDVTDDSSK